MSPARLPELALTAEQMLLVEDALALLLLSSRGVKDYGAIMRLLNAMRSASRLVLHLGGRRRWTL